MANNDIKFNIKADEGQAVGAFDRVVASMNKVKQGYDNMNNSAKNFNRTVSSTSPIGPTGPVGSASNVVGAIGAGVAGGLTAGLLTGIIDKIGSLVSSFESSQKVMLEEFRSYYKQTGSAVIRSGDQSQYAQSLIREYSALMGSKISPDQVASAYETARVRADINANNRLDENEKVKLEGLLKDTQKIAKENADREDYSTLIIALDNLTNQLGDREKAKTILSDLTRTGSVSQNYAGLDTLLDLNTSVQPMDKEELISIFKTVGMRPDDKDLIGAINMLANRLSKPEVRDEFTTPGSMVGILKELRQRSLAGEDISEYVGVKGVKKIENMIDFLPEIEQYSKRLKSGQVEIPVTNLTPEQRALKQNTQYSDYSTQTSIDAGSREQLVSNRKQQLAFGLARMVEGVGLDSAAAGIRSNADSIGTGMDILAKTMTVLTETLGGGISFKVGAQGVSTLLYGAGGLASIPTGGGDSNVISSALNTAGDFINNISYGTKAREKDSNVLIGSLKEFGRASTASYFDPTKYTSATGDLFRKAGEIKVDENGNIIYDKNGNPIYERSALEMTGQAGLAGVEIIPVAGGALKTVGKGVTGLKGLSTSITGGTKTEAGIAQSASKIGTNRISDIYNRLLSTGMSGNKQIINEEVFKNMFRGGNESAENLLKSLGINNLDDAAKQDFIDFYNNYAKTAEKGTGGLKDEGIIKYFTGKNFKSSQTVKETRSSMTTELNNKFKELADKKQLILDEASKQSEVVNKEADEMIKILKSDKVKGFKSDSQIKEIDNNINRIEIDRAEKLNKIQDKTTPKLKNIYNERQNIQQNYYTRLDKFDKEIDTISGLLGKPASNIDELYTRFNKPGLGDDYAKSIGLNTARGPSNMALMKGAQVYGAAANAIESTGQTIMESDDSSQRIQETIEISNEYLQQMVQLLSQLMPQQRSSQANKLNNNRNANQTVSIPAIPVGSL